MRRIIISSILSGLALMLLVVASIDVAGRICTCATDSVLADLAGNTRSASL